jgi:dihydroorotate dehydrogenase electron transfer subunit
MVYRVVGEGTSILSRVPPGTMLDVMGPLGTPFRPANSGRHILVGGGVGIPPMLFLAEWLLRHPERSEERAQSKDVYSPSFDSAPLVPRSTALRMPPEPGAQGDYAPGNVVALLGGRTANLVLCEADFVAIGIQPRVCTDDGSAGLHGLVTDLLEDALSDGAPATVYACGPIPMLRAVARMARQFNRSCQVSFEARMACGVGACLSCVIPTTEGYRRVCTEGPAFDAETVDWAANLDVM